MEFSSVSLQSAGVQDSNDPTPRNPTPSYRYPPQERAGIDCCFLTCESAGILCGTGRPRGRKSGWTTTPGWWLPPTTNGRCGATAFVNDMLCRNVVGYRFSVLCVVKWRRCSSSAGDRTRTECDGCFFLPCLYGIKVSNATSLHSLSRNNGW